MISPSSCLVLFYSLKHKSFEAKKSDLPRFSFMDLAFGVISKNSASPKVTKFSPCVF